MTAIAVNADVTASTLEVTITHNLRELAEVMVLVNQTLIALDWVRLESREARSPNYGLTVSR